MRAIVVYESHWGNTAAIARAIADGLGPEARALTTDEATRAALEGVDLIVAGAPVMAFRLPTEGTLESLANKPAKDGKRRTRPIRRCGPGSPVCRSATAAGRRSRPGCAGRRAAPPARSSRSFADPATRRSRGADASS